MSRHGAHRILILIACLALGTLGHASTSRAQEISAGIKGTVGLGLVGAELGLMVPAAVGLRDSWAYYAFPIAGAAGGGAAGFFLIDQANNVTLSVAAVTVGMAAVIPALIFTLSRASYDPAESHGGISKNPSSGSSSEDAAPTTDEVQGEPQASAHPSSAFRPSPSRPVPTGGLIAVRRTPDRSHTKVSLGVPSPVLTQSSSTLVPQQGGLQTEWHVPLLAGRF